jgi:rare lipoprotein A
MAAVVLVVSSARADGMSSPPTARTQKIRTASIASPAAAPSATIDRVAPRSRRPLSGRTLIGAASFYDDRGETASGERYDPKAFTAAVQLKLRTTFGGISFGRLYQDCYGLVAYAGKKLIVKFNDVGPLRPGRKFDLSRAAMKYFDGADKGVLPDVKVTVLPLGRTYVAGPVTDRQLATVGIGSGDFVLASLEGDEARKGRANQPETEPEKSAELAARQMKIALEDDYKRALAALVGQPARQ